ncbi:hypothetical protein VTL71DRAFT_200 [Oculimacula yallundae]|uniref:Uncharacterized protein n=1 Tax=Oculimacula yallundae TaxID=86028 RepID=A0ABR4D0A0_9HELO
MSQRHISILILAMSHMVWVFSCGHKMLRLDVGDEAYHGSNIKIYIGQSHPRLDHKCPGCVKLEQEAIKATQDKERKDKDTLAAYQAQADFISKQIEAAKGNEELVASLNKMLGSCRIVWADKLGEVELDSLKKDYTTRNILESSDQFIKRLDTALVKGRLCHSAELARRQRQKAIGKNNSKGGLAAGTKAEQWLAVVRELELAKTMYEEKVKDGFEDVQRKLSKSLVKATILMEETQKLAL